MARGGTISFKIQRRADAKENFAKPEILREIEFSKFFTKFIDEKFVKAIAGISKRNKSRQNVLQPKNS